jgi:hypothetical protein
MITDPTAAPPGRRETDFEWTEEFSIYGGGPRVRQTGAAMEDQMHPQDVHMLPDRAFAACCERARLHETGKTEV